MSVDIVLVSAAPLTVDDLRQRFDDAAVADVLGKAVIGGDPTAFPRITRVDTDRLDVDFYGSQEARTTGAAPYTTDLGVAAPKDAEGRTWWTQVEVVDGADDDAALEVLFGVLGSLAAAGGGHVVVDGEIADLDGSAAPLPSLAAPEGAPAPVTGRAFVDVFLPLAAQDQEGWGRTLGLVKRLAAGHAELLPRQIEVDGDVRPFSPSAEPPAWWPMEQYLSSPDPRVTWTLSPAGFPGDALSQVSLAADVDPATAADLLAPLLDLEPAYAVLHYWTEAEPVTGPIGLRRFDAGGPPTMFFTARDAAAYLPDVYWAQVLGPAWEERIGRDVLAATPAHRVEEVRPHHWLVQLTPRLGDVVEAWDDAAAARERCRAHLGAEHFWAPGRTNEPVLDLPPVVG